MIIIPKNTYEVSNECREEVVQMIVNAFLQADEVGNYDCSALPVCNNAEIVEHTFSVNKDKKLYCFKGDGIYPLGREHTILKKYKIRSCEAKEAVRMMIDSGYYFYETRSGYRKQLLFVLCSKRIKEPRTLEWWERRITSFDYTID